MSRVPMGKVLLRNVIRHTDAHNKIQEESEMWKLRGMEKGPSTSHGPMPPASNPSRSHMHCDRVEDGSVDRLGDRLRRREHCSSEDEREARYWTKKLYDFEANDPDRWGHSGFKELYPEEFKSDWEKDCGDDQNVHCRKKNTKSRLKTAKSKHLKKSSKKKKKKKEDKRRRTGESDGEASSDKSDSVKQKQKRKSRKRKRGKEEDRSSEDNDDEERGRRRAAAQRTMMMRRERGRRRRKRQMDSHRLRTRVAQEEEEKLESRRGHRRTVLRIEPFPVGSQ